MKNLISIFTFTVLILSSMMVQSAQLTSEQKISDFYQLIGRINASYGPLEYKKTHMNIDIEKLEKKYKHLVYKTKTNEEFYYLLTQFVAEFKDSHFAAILPNENRAKLPFTVELVQGKVLIDTISDDISEDKKALFKKGDELISIDGISVDQEIKNLLPYIGEGFEKTAEQFATWMLTSRRSARVPLKTGTSTVVVKTREKAEILTTTFDWEESGDDTPEVVPDESTTEAFGQNRSYYRKLSIENKIKQMLGTNQHSKIERSFICSGETRIEIPKDATIISKTPFVSYYYPTAKGNVGYVRIPHYSPEGDNADVAIFTAFSQYEKVINVMEKNTVALVIDQDHNCGGYVDLVNKLLGLFLDKPYKPMLFRMVANKENYLEYKSYAASIDPLTTWFEQTEKVMNLIKTTWQKGESRMTDFTTINGDEYMAPNLTRYTKPVVMTIDQMSGSGGDAFPALMKGYGRAKLIGTRTMGAGGHVTENPPLNYSQITVSMTRSLFYRPDGVEVENNGAVPDYPYEITIEDFVNGYKGYQQFFTEKVLEMVQ